MSFVDRINARLARRIRAARATLRVDGDALVLTEKHVERRYAPDRIACASLVRRDIYAGDIIVLRLGFDDGRVAEVAEDDPEFPALTRLLDRDGRIVMPSARWQVEAIARDVGDPPLVLLGDR